MEAQPGHTERKEPGRLGLAPGGDPSGGRDACKAALQARVSDSEPGAPRPADASSRTTRGARGGAGPGCRGTGLGAGAERLLIG